MSERGFGVRYYGGTVRTRVPPPIGETVGSYQFRALCERCDRQHDVPGETSAEARTFARASEWLAILVTRGTFATACRVWLVLCPPCKAGARGREGVQQPQGATKAPPPVVGGGAPQVPATGKPRRRG